jgi:hypothetical protein
VHEKLLGWVNTLDLENITAESFSDPVNRVLTLDLKLDVYGRTIGRIPRNDLYDFTQPGDAPTVEEMRFS